jgi:hypothetical protein
MQDGDSARCPVCRARFRDSSICSRCGADLEPLMLLLARTSELRNKAVQCLLAGDYEHAQKLASEAQAGHFTRRGEDLERLSAWLLRESVPKMAAGIADESEARATGRVPRDGSNPVLERKHEGHALGWCSVLVGIMSMGWITVKAVECLKGS